MVGRNVGRVARKASRKKCVTGCHLLQPKLDHVKSIGGRQYDKDISMHDNIHTRQMTADWGVSAAGLANRKSKNVTAWQLHCRDWLCILAQTSLVFGFQIQLVTLPSPARRLHSGRPPRMECSDWVPDGCLFWKACSASTYPAFLSPRLLS